MAISEENKRTWMLTGIAAVLLLVAFRVFFGHSSDAIVVGTATLESQPLAGAQVVFLADDARNPSPFVTMTDEQGKYKLLGNTGTGLPLGKYKVLLSKLTLKDGSLPSGEALEQARRDGLLLNTLPKIYEDLATTPWQFDLHAGSNTVNLDLKKQP